MHVRCSILESHYFTFLDYNHDTQRENNDKIILYQETLNADTEHHRVGRLYK